MLLPMPLRPRLLVLLVALAGPAAGAQTARPITLDEAIALVQTQGVIVRQAETLVGEREADVAEARGRFLPAASVYTAGSQRYGRSFDETAGELTQQRTEAVQVGGQAEWTLYDGGTRQATLARARAELARVGHDRERVVQTAVHGVIEQFYAVAVAQAEARIARANVEAQRQQLALVEATISAGVRPRVERLQQEERLAEAELGVLQADRAERSAGLRLVHLLALDPSGEYRFVPPAEASPADMVPLDPAVLTARALERRADLRAQEASVAAAEASVRAARSGGRPSLSLVFGYGTSFSTGADGGLGPQFGDNRGGALGLQLGVPLFDRALTRSRVRAAAARADRARIDRDAARRTVALDIRQALLDYQLLLDEARVGERRLAAARASLDAETERYRLGMTTLGDLAEARARALAADVGLRRTEAALAFQRALIDYRTGG